MQYSLHCSSQPFSLPLPIDKSASTDKIKQNTWHYQFHPTNYTIIIAKPNRILIHH